MVQMWIIFQKENNVDIYIYNNFTKCKYSYFSNRTVLMMAIFNGNLKMIEMLIKNGTDINSYDIPEHHPLHLAIKYK